MASAPLLRGLFFLSKKDNKNIIPVAIPRNQKASMYESADAASIDRFCYTPASAPDMPHVLSLHPRAMRSGKANCGFFYCGRG
jgi:hypothetical protein